MPLGISLNSKTSTSVILNMLNRTGGLWNVIDIQYSTRPDFMFVPSPIAAGYPNDPVLNIGMLNQGNTYYFRARERQSVAGTIGPWTDALAVYLAINAVQDVTPPAVMIRPAIVVVPEPIAWETPGGFADAGHPVTNLASDAPLEEFWSTSNGIVVDFNTPGAPIDTIALLRTNAPRGMTWSATSYPTSGDRGSGTNSVFTTGAVQFHASQNLPGRPFYHGMHRLAAPRSESFWRLHFGGDVPPGYIFTVGFGVVGLARQAKNIAADKVETPLDYGSLDRLRDGTPDRRSGVRGRRVEFEIALMTEAQWETQFADLRNAVGFTDPVLVVPNTRAGSFLHDRILYGPMAQNRAQQPFTPRHSAQFTIESLI